MIKKNIPVFVSKSKTEKRDLLLSRLVSLYFVLALANYSLKTYFVHMPVIVSMINSVVMTVLVVTMFLSLMKVYKINKAIIQKSYLLFGFLLLVGCLINSSNGYPNDIILKENAVWNLGLWIPLGCSVCSIRDKNILYKELLRASYVMDIFLAFSFLTRQVYTEYGLVAYNMSYGTYILLPLLLHLNEFLKRKSKIVLIVLFLELFTLLVYGNRGGLLAIAFFIFTYFVLSNKSSKSTTIFIALSFAVIFIVLLSGEFLLGGLHSSLSSHGIQSRTLDMFFSGDITLSTERDELRAITLDMIKESPILGWGFGGEYYEVAKRFGSTTLGVSSYYNPHNGILQNLVEFGVVLGLIATFLLVKPLFGTRTVRNGTYKDLLMIFGSLAIISRLISAAGFFTHPEVAVFVYLYYFRNRFGKVDVS